MVKSKTKKINLRAKQSHKTFDAFEKIKHKAMKLFMFGLTWIFLSYSLLNLGYLVFSTDVYAAEELLEQAFRPSIEYDGIINLWDTKDAVWNEVFRQGAGIQNAAGIWCFVQWQRLTSKELDNKASELGYSLSADQSLATRVSDAEKTISNSASNATKNTISNVKDEITNFNEQWLIDNVVWGTKLVGDVLGTAWKEVGGFFGTTSESLWDIVSQEDKYKYFCESVLWWDWDVSAITTKAPLVVRITKFLLRMTIVLSITMVLYSGVMYIVESSKGAEVKETTNSLMYIIGWVLLALMSLWILNLISSIWLSTFGWGVGG